MATVGSAWKPHGQYTWHRLMCTLDRENRHTTTDMQVRKITRGTGPPQWPKSGIPWNLGVMAHRERTNAGKLGT